MPQPVKEWTPEEDSKLSESDPMVVVDSCKHCSFIIRLLLDVSSCKMFWSTYVQVLSTV